MNFESFKERVSADANVGADLGGVEVVVDKILDDLGKVLLNEAAAELLKGIPDPAKGHTDLYKETDQWTSTICKHVKWFIKSYLRSQQTG